MSSLQLDTRNDKARHEAGTELFCIGSSICFGTEYSGTYLVGGSAITSERLFNLKNSLCF